MRINGTINEWNVLNQEFKLLTMTGEYTIGTGTLDTTVADQLVDAMKNRRTVTLTDECNDPDRGPAPLLDYPGYGEGADIYGRWAVREIIEQAVSRSFLLRIWDGEPPEGQINIHVPRNTAELARQYIAVSLLYGDLYRKAEALAYEIGEGTDTKAKLKEIIDKHNRRMEGRA